MYVYVGLFSVSKLDFCLNFMVCTGDIQLQDTVTVRRHSWIVVKVTPGANNIILHLSLYSSYCTYRDTAPTSLSTSRHIEIDHVNYTYSVLSKNTFLYSCIVKSKDYSSKSETTRTQFILVTINISIVRKCKWIYSILLIKTWYFVYMPFLLWYKSWDDERNRKKSKENWFLVCVNHKLKRNVICPFVFNDVDVGRCYFSVGTPIIIII